MPKLTNVRIAAGPQGLFDRGQLVMEVDDLTAERLKSLGQAVDVKEYQERYDETHTRKYQYPPPQNRIKFKQNEQDELDYLEQQEVRQSGVDSEMQMATALVRLAEILERLESKIK